MADQVSVPLPAGLRGGSAHPSKIVNLYHCTADNVGDRMCGPGQHLWPELTQSLPLEPVHEQVSAAIIGGGQLFLQLSLVLASIYDLNPNAKVVGWGVGLPPAGVRDEKVRAATQHFSLFGTRNYDRREHLPFVPCASCLSPVFDDIPPTQHEVVFYLHRRKGQRVDLPPSAPTLTNAMRSPREVVDFIASGETVVTSSYHGVYWAQLMGRRVICLPYNDKFQTFQYLPTMLGSDEWKAGMAFATQTPPLLEEYRALNFAFAQRALDLWNE